MSRAGGAPDHTAATTTRTLHRVTHEEAVRSGDDEIAVEEPMELRIEHEGQNVPFMVTMRTPGDDVALATGFLFTEGIVDAPEDLLEVRPCREEGPDGETVENVVQAWLGPGSSFDAESMRRSVFMSSSCGVCGKATLDALAVKVAPLPAVAPLVKRELLFEVPDALRAAQQGFRATGGTHATGVFRADGTLVHVAEDVGRHNAMDKAVGRAFLDDALPLTDRFLAVSGRLSFELVQKAARAGCPMLAGIGAPSSLAVDTAHRLGLTLIGFLADGRFNVYTHPGRVQGLGDAAPRSG